jgi:hypothetical protein
MRTYSVEKQGEGLWHCLGNLRRESEGAFMTLTITYNPLPENLSGVTHKGSQKPGFFAYA